ncbi:sensor histidine kinase [Okibacterium endophyticum]
MSSEPQVPEQADPFDPSWHRPAITHAQMRRDAILAGALFLGAVLATPLYSIAGVYAEPANGWIAVVWAVVITLPLAFRRRWPIPVAVVVSIAFIVGGELSVPEALISSIALFTAIYSVGAWVSNRRVAALSRIVITTVMFIWLVIGIFRAATNPETLESFPNAGALSPFVSVMMIQVLTNLLYFGGAYYFGDAAFASARQRAVLEQRSDELEVERERNAAQAVTLERVRIARELHDVVAHHVSLMGVQAAAARTVLDTDPAAARESLEGVEAGARTAIDELHNLLHTLRGSGPDAPAHESASTLGVAALPALAEESSAAGLPTTFGVIGEQGPITALISLNLYRIAQEALTNARKYAGPGATADVRLRHLDHSLELEVTNTGIVPARTRARGLGHAGMRERADAMGATLELGPRSRGGYLVRVSIPRPAAERMPADRLAASRPSTPRTAPTVSSAERSR